MRTITAKFNSLGTCGHTIRKGDRIGWDKASSRTACTGCLTRDDVAADDSERFTYYGGNANAYNEGWL
jgi:hypothetical protein